MANLLANSTRDNVQYNLPSYVLERQENLLEQSSSLNIRLRQKAETLFGFPSVIKTPSAEASAPSVSTMDEIAAKAMTISDNMRQLEEVVSFILERL